MAAAPKRLCWEACAWIAMIQDEKVTLSDGKIEYRGQMCRDVMGFAEKAKGAIEIVTSSLCLAEVCKDKTLRNGQDDQMVRAYFDHPHVLLVHLDREVGHLARRLMSDGHAGLKPPDAVHVASAVIAGAEQLHTFDGKLLALDRKVNGLDGTPLRICKPERPSTSAAPLLEDMQDVT